MEGDGGQGYVGVPSTGVSRNQRIIQAGTMNAEPNAETIAQKFDY